MGKLPQITLLFWIMKICAITLGKTAGDLLSITLHVGYAVTSPILIGVFLATFLTRLLSTKFHPVLYWTVILSTRTATVLHFWIAFVLTRPLGATAGDLPTKTPEKGGLGFGTIGSSAVLFAVLAALIIYRNSRAGRARH